MVEHSLNSNLTENVGFNKSLENYVRAARFLNIASRNIYRESLPLQVIDSWTNVLGAMRIADTIIDSEANSKKRSKIMKGAIRYLRSGDIDLLDINSNLVKYEKVFIKLRADINNLDESNKESFLSKLQRVFEISEKIKTTNVINDYSSLTRLEGQIVSRLILIFIPQEFRVGPEHANFIKFVTRLTRVGNLGDKFFDMPTDFIEKEITCSPSIPNRLLLLSKMFIDTPAIIKSLHVNQLQDAMGMFYRTFENNTGKQKKVSIR